jgi:hypothetical protein
MRLNFGVRRRGARAGAEASARSPALSLKPASTAAPLFRRPQSTSRLSQPPPARAAFPGASQPSTALPSADLLAERTAVRWQDPPSRWFTPIPLPHAPHGIWQFCRTAEPAGLQEAESWCRSSARKRAPTRCPSVGLPTAGRPRRSRRRLPLLGCTATPQPGAEVLPAGRRRSAPHSEERNTPSVSATVRAHVSYCRRATSPNVALQPTCGARLRRGGELRRRRMRLNFGVRHFLPLER